MDKQQAYSKIDELFSQYINCKEKDKIKSDLLKVICDVVNSDYKYKSHIENGDFDYLPVLTAINDALKYFNQRKEGSFHSYLFSCIHNAVIKDIEENANPIVLNYANIKLKKKIKKLLTAYKDNKKEVAKALDISVEKLNALLDSEKTTSNVRKNEDGTETNVWDYIKSEVINEDQKIELEKQYDKIFNIIDDIIKDIKPIHQVVISDWLTATFLSYVENSKSIPIFNNKEEIINYFKRFSFVSHIIVNQFFNYKNYELPVTYEAIAEIHGITKGAVSKKIDVFLNDIRIKTLKDIFEEMKY
ncbi:MAG: hypothetical protein PUA64_01465 [Treponema sp.]|nr:hypothetical protein [Treponema sp.]